MASEVAALTANKRKRNPTHTPQPIDRVALPMLDKPVAMHSAKKLRETGVLTARDSLSDTCTPPQSDNLHSTLSPGNTYSRTPRTPEIAPPPRIRPKKLSFTVDEGPKDHTSACEHQAHAASPEEKEKIGDADNAVERKGPSKASESSDNGKSKKQLDGKLSTEKLSAALDITFSPSVGKADLGENKARRQSPRLIVKAQLPETRAIAKVTKSKQEKVRTPNSEILKESRKNIKSLRKKDKLSDKAGGKVNSKAKKRPKIKWLHQVIVDGTRFQIGDDVYVRRSEEEVNEEDEKCLVCGKAGRLIECDSCSGGVHLKCADPPLKEVPSGDWLCINCSVRPTDRSSKGQSSQPRATSHKKRPKTAREMLISSELWAARIERLWRDMNGSYTFKGRWYVIPEETAVGRQPHNLRRELFRTNQFDENEVASILRRCFVMCPEDFRSSGREGDDVYLCEYEYDTQFQTFKRISDIEEVALASSDELGGTFNSSYECEDDQSDKEIEQNRRKHLNLKPSGKSQKAPTFAGAANSRSGRKANMDKVGVKTIPLAVRKKSVTIFEKAKAALRLTAVPNSLPCRDKEMGEISAFVSDATLAGDGSLGHCLYISGVPGTGKSATVLEVMQKLKSRFEDKKTYPYRFVEINGLRLTSPEYLYTVLHESLTGHHLGWKKALQLLDERFSNSKPSRQTDARPCILLIDELDLLVTRNQSVLYNVFDWPTRPYSRLFVIGIANTIDLPERLLPRITSRMGLQRVSFSPYSYEQLQTIISSRLEAIDAFENQAIEFASRKVAAVSGDARRALELCRRAVEVAEARCLDLVQANSNSSKRHNSTACPTRGNLVSMANVEEAIKEMFQAPHIKIMGRCTKLAKIFLVSMVYEQHKTGMVETTFEKVAMTFSFLCKSNNESSLDWDTLLAIGCGLGACRLIICEPGAHHRLQKLQLNFPTDDVSFALKEDLDISWIGKYL